jgi:HlyD family secretion protein
MTVAFKKKDFTTLRSTSVNTIRSSLGSLIQRVLSSLPARFSKGKTIAALGVVVFIVLLVILFFPSKKTEIPSFKVKKGDFSVFVIESGSMRSKNSSTITAPRLLTGGNLQIVFLAPEGTIAEKDQLLIRFDPSTAMKRIQDKQTELKTVLADFAKLKAQQSADGSQAKTEFETAKLNFQLAEIAKNKMEFEPEAKKREANLEFERAKLSFEQSKLNVGNKGIVRKSERGNLQLKISQIKSDIEGSIKEMDQLAVKAPLSGLIVYENNWSTGRKIAVGDQPWPGMPLISLPDLSEMQVEVSINEMDIAKVKSGQTVIVTPDAFPDKQFTGVITSVSQIGREKGSGSNIKVFDIVIDLKGTDPVLKPGITTTNKVVIETIRDVLSVPIVSVVEEEKKTVVYVKKGNSFSKREVVLGARNDNFVVVKKGLAAGEEVALRNPEAKDEPDTQQESKQQPAPAMKKK